MWIIKPLRGISWRRTQIITLQMIWVTLKLTSPARRILSSKLISRYRNLWDPHPTRGSRLHSKMKRYMETASKSFTKIKLRGGPYSGPTLLAYLGIRSPQWNRMVNRPETLKMSQPTMNQNRASRIWTCLTKQTSTSVWWAARAEARMPTGILFTLMTSSEPDGTSL